MNTVNLNLGGGSLLQVANRSLIQMMSYIIDCPNGGCIVIDGGFYCREDAEILYKLLLERGKKVDLWFITHAHSDHLGAMLYLMENNKFDIEVEKLCFKFPDWAWFSKKEEKEEQDIVEKFLKLSKKYVKQIITSKAGERFEIGGISAEILSVPEDYESYPNVNSTSLIIKVHFPKRDVLFLGDFDEYAEEEYIRKHGMQKIKSDIVQMAHHGQAGVTKMFYEIINPEICLYTAPQWLWENNKYICTNPETVGKGPFTIMETRRWMEELNVKQSYSHKDGDYKFI